MPVDGEPVEFAVLRDDDYWVAQAIIGNTVVGIKSRNWPLERTGLRVEDTLERYARGSEELQRRWLHP